MRILMLNYEFPPLGGGAANANYYMLKEFAKVKDLEVDLITSSANNKFEAVWRMFTRGLCIGLAFMEAAHRERLAPNFPDKEVVCVFT